MQREKIFKKRFDDYYPMLCQIAGSYIDHDDECEDIVQESFIAVWNKDKDGLPEKEFVAYMVRAVKNNCLSFLRKQRTEVVSFENTLLKGENLDVAEEEGDSGRYEEALERILAVLPPKCRDVFLMSKLHQMKYKEIADKMNISEKTVENHMGKALKMIRELVASGQYLIFLGMVLLMIKK